MGWWKRRAGRSVSEAPVLPASLSPRPQDVAPGVRACYVDLATHEGSRPCWSFLTRGLVDYGQAEILLSYVPSGSERLEDVGPPLLKFLEILRQRARQGRKVGAGESSSFLPPAKVLGATGVLYLPGPTEGLVESSHPWLCVVPLFGPEADAVVRLGLPRIAGRIGLHFQAFPCPVWWPSGRGVVAALPGDDASLLARLPHASLRGLYARVEGGLRAGERRRLLLRADPTGRDALRSVLAQAIERVAFALLPGIDAEADSLMVWLPSDPVPTAIARGASPSLHTGLCFVALGFPADRDRWTQIEDGATALLTAESWSRLRRAVERGEPTELAMCDGRTLALEWIPAP